MRKATNIKWDVDDSKDLSSLPVEVELPDDVNGEEEISDYITDLTGFCHKGFNIEDDGCTELSDAQVERNDEIYNEVFDLCKIMAENENLEWDMEIIGQIADYAAELLSDHGIKVRFPSIVTEPDGTEHIEEYY